MRVFDPERKKVTGVLLLALASTGIVALATRSEAMRPDGWSSTGCSNMGPGLPDEQQGNPICIAIQSGPDCYLCYYSPPQTNYWWRCAENHPYQHPLAPEVCDTCGGPDLPDC